MSLLLLLFLVQFIVITLVQGFQLRQYRNLHQKDRRIFAIGTSDNEGKDTKKFSIGGLIQLITMGAGAPSLGEYKRTDENGRMIFELEANNFADADGNSKQLKGKYFLDGYVDEEENDKPPGFWSNLISGGRLQKDWEEKLPKKKN